MLILLVVQFSKKRENVMFHHHSSIGKAISFVAFLVLCLTAVAVGLLAFNVEVINSPVVQTHFVSFIRPAYIIAGVAGLLGLVFLVSGCGSCKCDTNHNHNHNHKRD
ncbi:MAG: hypothetical protein P4L22_05560 [Candidatus Babeliales bacterium]|nr:hypothetical protein [Candidatus Babeliales bacterium]